MADFDWRAYARERGVDPWRAWHAMQQATSKVRVPGPSVRVTSPATLDEAAADPDMHAFIRGVIDDLATPNEGANP